MSAENCGAGMQISRHWRLNAQRYRLQGVRYPDGHVALVKKDLPRSQEPEQNTQITEITVYQSEQSAAD